MSIYVATHKNFDYKLKENYIPIQVGAELKDDLGYLKDNGGDNISLKNPNYCELTALYFIANNRQSDDVVGLVHYRRYFFYGLGIIDYKKACDLLKKCDIILPYKHDFKESVENQYKHYHNIEDLKLCGKVIKEKYPAYFDSFKKVMKKRYICAFNMFIMNSELLKDYSNWLFSILFEVEKKVNIEEYDDYNKRIFGFLSERLFNVWIEKKNLNIKYLPVYNVDDPFYKHVKDFIAGGVRTYLK